MFMALAEFLLAVGGLTLIGWLVWKGWTKESAKEAELAREQARRLAEAEISEVLDEVKLVEKLSDKVDNLNLDKVRKKKQRIEEVKKI